MTKRVMSLLWLMAMTFGIATHAQSIIPKKDDKKGTWGYVSKSDGKWVVKPKYDGASELTESPSGQLRGTVSIKGLKGFIDDTGKIQGAGVVFEEMTPLEGDALFVKVKGKTGVADNSGVYKVKPEAESVEQLGDEGWIMTIKGKKGILKNDGTWLLQPVYNELNVSVDDVFIVSQGGKAGILNRQGQVKLQPKDYSKIEPMGELWKVYKGDKVGLLNHSGNEVLVQPKYSDVGTPIEYKGGFKYPVAVKGKWGYVNSKGKYIVKPNYQSYLPLPELSAILLSTSTVPNYIEITGEPNILSVTDYNTTTDGIFQKRSFKYKKANNYIPVVLITLPDRRTVYTQESSPISRKKDFYEVSGNYHYSIWDKDGKNLYYGVADLSPVDKYLYFVQRANESDSWKSYVQALEDDALSRISNTGDYTDMYKLYETRDVIGEEMFLKFLDSCPDKSKIGLFEDALKNDKEFGKILLERFDQKNLSEEQKKQLFEIAKENGMLQDNFKVGDFEYRILGMEEVSAKYNGHASSVAFPSQVEYNGQTYSVTGIDGAPGNNTLVTVTIPEGIKTIFGGAFEGCSKLTTVNLPKNNKIDCYGDSFGKCPLLATVNNFDYDLEKGKDTNGTMEFKKFLWVFSESPKMLDQFLKEMMATIKPEQLLSTVMNRLFDDSFNKHGDYYIGKVYASRVLGKRILEKLAGSGNAEAMSDLCYAYTQDVGPNLVSPSDYLKYAKMLISKRPAWGYYYMGLAYEYGVGVKPSRSTAHSYYGKGRELNDKHCDNGYWRTF